MLIELFHGFQVDTLTSQLGGGLVLGQQLVEARDFTLGLQHDLGLVAFGFLFQTLDLTTGLGLDFTGIGFRFTDEALLIFLGGDGVIEGVFHLFRRTRRQEVDVDDLQTHLVGLYDAIDHLPGLLTDFFPTRGQDIIHLGVTHHVAQGAVGGLAQTLVGIGDAEQILLGIDHAVLHVHLDPDHVLVLGQHEAGGRQGAHRFHIHRDHPIDEGRLPAQTRIHVMGVLPKTQHHAPLGFANGVEAADDPHHHGHHQGDGEAKLAHITTRFATTEQATETTAHLAQHLIQIRGSLILAVVPPRVTVFAVVTRLIPSHQRLH
ncbi:hypothetical protein D3C78_474610 [compost metagenome]